MSAARPGWRIRRFRPPDFDSVMEIERASFGRWAYREDQMMDYCRDCADLFLVACSGTLMAGYSVACRKGESAELISIAVHPAHRKSGVGRGLLDATVRRLRRLGVARLTLTVKENNRPARRFYERYGFGRVRIVRGYYEDGRNGVRMSLPLS